MLLKQAKDYPDLLDKKALKAFLKPVSKAEPSGKSLRYESEYDDIQLARKSEEDLPQGVWAHELKESQWDKVEKSCVQALQGKSKDLQLSLWLTEAWFYEYQAYGLKSGMKLTKSLLKTFWKSFHPFSKDDPEYRVYPLLWFDKEMAKALSHLIVALPGGDFQHALTFWDYQSKVLGVTPDQQKTSQGGQNKMSPDAVAFYEVVGKTDAEFYEALFEELTGALEEIKEIEALVVGHYDEFPGCLMHLRSRLEKAHHFVKNICQDRTPALESVVAEVINIETQNAPKTDPETPPLPESKHMVIKSLNIKGTLQNRQQAYELLTQIANFLSEIEPHSPTPYLIRRAVTWGDMSLGDLMTELAQESGDMQHALRFLGMDKRD